MDTKDHSSSSDLSPSSQPGLPHKPVASRSKFKKTRPSVFGGVRGDNGSKRVCKVPKPNKKSRLWLGTFATPEMAARAHDDSAIALHSRSGPLNFPESAWALPYPRSVSSVDVRNAAAEASEMYKESPGHREGPKPEHKKGPKPKMVFVDEEEMFNMPELMNEMAVGMLVNPLAMQRGFDWDGLDSYVDLSLWCD